MTRAISLANLTAWCDDRFGRHSPEADLRPRPYDVPWLVMDSGDSGRDFGWRAESELESILAEIATHAQEHPDWLERSGL